MEIILDITNLKNIMKFFIISFSIITFFIGVYNYTNYINYINYYTPSTTVEDGTIIEKDSTITILIPDIR
jgi:hypothetical protein